MHRYKIVNKSLVVPLKKKKSKGVQDHKTAYCYTPARPDWRPGGRGLEPHRGQQHSFMEIDHEIFSKVILPLLLIQEGQLSVSGERMCIILQSLRNLSNRCRTAVRQTEIFGRTK